MKREHGRGTARNFGPCSLCQDSKSLSGSTKGRTMKSRLLIRAMCVGAALLVPAGGLTVLGIGTAGAVTIKTVAPSTAKLGTVGTLTLAGMPCHTITKTVKRTVQCTISNFQGTLKRAGIVIGKGLITIHLLITITNSIIKGVKIKTIKIVLKTPTTSGSNGCKINGIPSETYSGSSTSWSITTKSLSAVTVGDTSSVGPCHTAVAIQSEITAGKLSSTITFSNI